MISNYHVITWGVGEILYRIGFTFFVIAVISLYLLYPLILFNGTFRFL